MPYLQEKDVPDEHKARKFEFRNVLRTRARAAGFSDELIDGDKSRWRWYHEPNTGRYFYWLYVGRGRYATSFSVGTSVKKPRKTTKPLGQRERNGAKGKAGGDPKRRRRRQSRKAESGGGVLIPDAFVGQKPKPNGIGIIRGYEQLREAADGLRGMGVPVTVDVNSERLAVTVGE